MKEEYYFCGAVGLARGNIDPKVHLSKSTVVIFPQCCIYLMTSVVTTVDIIMRVLQLHWDYLILGCCYIYCRGNIIVQP